MLANPHESPITGERGSADARASESACNQGEARDLGLASLIMGAALFVTAPVVLILAVQVWKYADRTPDVVVLHAWLARLGCPVILTVGGVSVWAGFKGVQQAKVERNSPILPIAGMFFSIVALITWIIAAIGVLNTTESLVRLSA